MRTPMIDRMTPERITYITLSASIAFLAFVIGVVIIPSTKKVHDLEKDITNIRISLEERYTRSQRLHKTSLKLSDIKNQTKSWRGALLEKGKEVDIIKFFENLAVKNSVAMKLTPTPLKQKGSLLKHGLDIEINMSGDFKNIMKFLHALDQSDYYVNFKDLKIQRIEGKASAASESENVVFAKLSGVVYSYGEK